jgi:hypothetical protein
MERYFDTLLYLYKRRQSEAAPVIAATRFCLPHIGELMCKNDKALNAALTANMAVCMEELNGDIEWFIKKFDYLYADEPWKNAKDAVERAVRLLGANIK